jgi:hypothetical protein
MMMDDKFAAKIVIDPFSLLVVNSKGELKRIYCPFLARCMIPINNLLQNEAYVIDMVKTDLSEEIIFIIQGRPFLHSFFNILP